MFWGVVGGGGQGEGQYNQLPVPCTFKNIIPYFSIDNAHPNAHDAN